MEAHLAAWRCSTTSCSASVRFFLFVHLARSAKYSLTLSLSNLGVRNQFTSLYRYGTARECAAKWEDFKFCLSTRSLSEERKEEEWIRRRAEHWAERRVGPSSEDIWEAKKLHWYTRMHVTVTEGGWCVAFVEVVIRRCCCNHIRVLRSRSMPM